VTFKEIGGLGLGWGSEFKVWENLTAVYCAILFTFSFVPLLLVPFLPKILDSIL